MLNPIEIAAILKSENSTITPFKGHAEEPGVDSHFTFGHLTQDYHVSTYEGGMKIDETGPFAPPPPPQFTPPPWMPPPPGMPGGPSW